MIRYVDTFGNVFLLRNPIEVVDNGGFIGPCFRAELKLEDDPRGMWTGPGDFRLNKAVLIESVPEQMELVA